MSKKILIVDDEIILRKTVSRLLEKKGYEVISSDNGRDGYKVAKYYQPDIILMDLQMPEVNGIETCNMLRSNASTKAIPIIIVTAYATADVVGPITDMGIEHHIEKPFDIQDLISKMDQIFYEKAA